MRENSFVAKACILVLLYLVDATFAGRQRPTHELRMPVVAVAPSYDIRLVHAILQGPVVVEVTVSRSGAVSSAELLESIYPPLDELHLAYARRWRFQEANLPTTQKIEFIYRFLPKATPAEELGVVFIAPTTVEIRRHEPEPITIR